MTELNLTPLLFNGMDCGTDTAASEEYYVLKDSLWRYINPMMVRMLCLTCAEERLGRRLCKTDLQRLPLNASDLIAS